MIGGNMRNGGSKEPLKQHITGRRTEQYTDAKAAGCCSPGLCAGREYAEL